MVNAALEPKKKLLQIRLQHLNEIQIFVKKKITNSMNILIIACAENNNYERQHNFECSAEKFDEKKIILCYGLYLIG